jgi:diguanylate cyclase (GGDEF)-like protein
MRIRDNLPPGSTARIATAKPVARARNPEAASAAAATGTAPQADQATFLGLNETELSPNVRAALMALLDEDSMLPIAHRRAFVRELTRLISYCERYGTAGSVLYFDLNGMKEINDRYGHPAGDEALRHFARLLVANVRDSDIVGRLGGDEFGVILAQADETQARDKAASLVQLVQNHPVMWQGEPLQLSCAVGIHQFSARQNADEALSKADADMYDEKRRYYAELNKQR